VPKGPSWLHLLADSALILLGFWAAYALRFESGWIGAPLGVIARSDWMLLALCSLPLWLLILSLHGAYYTRLKQAFSSELSSLTHAVAEGFVATILLTFSLRNLPDSRLALLLAAALSWLLLAVARALARKLRRRRPRAAVIGEGPLAQYLTRQFAGQATRFDLAAAYASVADFDPAGVDVVFCDSSGAEALWQRLSGPGAAGRPANLAVYILPQSGAEAAGAVSVATVEGVPTLAVKSAADLAVMRSVKRAALDLPASLLLLLLTSPLWLFCVLGILLTMPGPLFFRHKRLGLFGREFGLLKFRSMVRDAAKIQVDLEGFDEQYKLKNDPRITTFGRLLRKLSLDELPQLINILRGEMSLVGPRPIVAPELPKYGVWGGLLTTVPPGLSGLWQVSGRSDTSYQQRIDFDLYYINNWSLGLDLLILLRTIPAVLSRRGAY
jgi:exopolysaccharide biosynthesis polyprenyl glycosylphosphotransferase